MNLPNKLSLLRIILIPVMIAVFYFDFLPYNYLYCALIFAVSAVTDFLDGYIARKYNLVTDLGKFLDPIADKILVGCSFIILLTKPEILGVYGEKFYQIAGGVGVSIIIAREFMVSALRMIASSKGVVLYAEKVGKIKTFCTDFAILTLLISAEFEVMFLPAVILYFASVLLTIYSGVFYLVKNKGIFSESR